MHPDLTGAERRVALLVAWGGTNRDVAETLGIELKEVDRHLARVYRKLAIHSRAELSMRAGGGASNGGPANTDREKKQ
jgi:DNA-binding CsgD family transcriptional regulator